MFQQVFGLVHLLEHLSGQFRYLFYLDEDGDTQTFRVPAHHPSHAGPCLSDGNQATCSGTGRKGDHYDAGEELIPLTVLEVRRLLTRLVWTENQPPDFILYWSRWRRRHQARAQRCHCKGYQSNLRL